MIKIFGQWKVVNEGIVTIPGCEYYWISKENIMQNDTEYAKKLMKCPSVNNQSLRKAYRYAYKYFHAMTKFTSKSHPEIYKAMMAEFKELQWYKSNKGLTTKTSEGLNITVFRADDDKWKWVYDEISQVVLIRI